MIAIEIFKDMPGHEKAYVEDLIEWFRKEYPNWDDKLGPEELYRAARDFKANLPSEDEEWNAYEFGATCWFIGSNKNDTGPIAAINACGGGEERERIARKMAAAPKMEQTLKFIAALKRPYSEVREMLEAEGFKDGDNLELFVINKAKEALAFCNPGA